MREEYNFPVEEEENEDSLAEGRRFPSREKNKINQHREEKEEFSLVEEKRFPSCENILTNLLTSGLGHCKSFFVSTSQDLYSDWAWGEDALDLIGDH